MRRTVAKSNEDEAQDRNCRTAFSFNGAESGLKCNRKVRRRC